MSSGAYPYETEGEMTIAEIQRYCKFINFDPDEKSKCLIDDSMMRDNARLVREWPIDIRGISKKVYHGIAIVDGKSSPSIVIAMYWNDEMIVSCGYTESVEADECLEIESLAYKFASAIIHELGVLHGMYRTDNHWRLSDRFDELNEKGIDNGIL